MTTLVWRGDYKVKLDFEANHESRLYCLATGIGHLRQLYRINRHI
jgi:hypothetical protein